MPTHLCKSGTFNFSRAFFLLQTSSPVFSCMAPAQNRKASKNVLSACHVLGPLLVAYVSYLTQPL